jgi:hypothetical protein
MATIWHLRKTLPIGEWSIRAEPAPKMPGSIVRGLSRRQGHPQ